MNLIIAPTLANMGGLFSTQGLVIFVILLLLFGAKRLPELAKGLGQAIREFSKAKNEISDEIHRAPEPAQQIAATPASPVQPAQNTQPYAATPPAAAPTHPEQHV